jgi:RNA polymerase sigma-70 factor (ECF subfamily)
MEEAHGRFTALVHAWSGDLFRFAYWLCRNRAQAEDSVQETFLRAWRALDTLRDEAVAKSWLFTILRREFLRRPASAFETDSDGLDIPAPRVDGLEGWAVRRALHALPIEYREPLLLQVLGGYRCEEIAAILELPPGTMMTRLFRARQKLRAVLAPDPPTEIDAEYSHELS